MTEGVPWSEKKKIAGTMYSVNAHIALIEMSSEDNTYSELEEMRYGYNHGNTEGDTGIFLEAMKSHPQVSTDG